MKKGNIKIAHSAEPEKGVPEQPYESHIHGVLSICKRHLKRLQKHLDKSIYSVIERVVLLAAEWHDLGKLDKQAQFVMKGGHKKRKMINHVDAGVAHLVRLYQKTHQLEYLIAAFLVHAHHIGFQDFKTLFEMRQKRVLVEYAPLKAIRCDRSCSKYGMRDTPVCEHVDQHLSEYINHHIKLVETCESHQVSNDKATLVFANPLLLRLALSVLCDADHEDTSLNYKDVYPQRKLDLDPVRRFKRLSRFVQKLSEKASLLRRHKVLERNRLRDEFFKRCAKHTRSDSEYDFHLIDGPVGIGKTLGMMAKALTIAIKEKLSSIVVVLPLIALIDQSADEYRKSMAESKKDALWNINVIHHLLKASGRFHRKYVKGLNSPFSLTTSVNIFAIATSNATTILRNLHKLVGSVICFDEYHAMAEYEYWSLIMRIIGQMAKHFNCKFIFSSGTPIEYWSIDQMNNSGRELMVHRVIPNKMYSRMVQFEKRRLKVRHLRKPIHFQKLAEMVAAKRGSVFVVFETRPKAFRFSQIIRKYTKKTVYLRYSASASVDRAVQFKKVKRDMRRRKDIIFITTEGGDIGLDLSFHHGFKEITGALSFFQMTGRVNRHGEFKNSTATVFKLKPYPDLENQKWQFHENPSFIQKKKVFQENRERFTDPTYCTEVAQEEVDILSEDKADKIQQFLTLWDTKAFGTLSKSFRLINSPMIKLLVNKDIYERILRGDFVPYQEIEENIVTIFHNPYLLERIKDKILYVPLGDEDDDDNESGKSPESADEIDFDGLYFWTGKYDKKQAGIMADPAIMNRPEKT